MKFGYFIPLIIGLTLGLALGSGGWWGFLVIFPWIGASITIGTLIAAGRKGRKKEIGRRLSLLLISPVFLIFLGIMQRENLQIEETVFYTLLLLNTGIFTRVLIHYAIAKIIGPLIWGRGYCGWACWTAALMEWLPVRDKRPVPRKLTLIRYPVLLLSILLPLVFVWLGYDWVGLHVIESGTAAIMHGKVGSILWFLVGNGIYYIAAVWLAFRFGKRRAFCKIACPVSLVMKAQTRVSLLRVKPTGNECTGCGACNRSCPMDVDVRSYIAGGSSIRSTECILCGNCSAVCPVMAIR
ncbi:MAG: 4Fe-4S dicluster domain-containing protein [Tannerellaceae bacterium]|jgi:polyferredoxin|nr:4Fe-4S dicluster domain-containing protein [Tannerellaceae bacterium]